MSEEWSDAPSFDERDASPVAPSEPPVVDLDVIAGDVRDDDDDEEEEDAGADGDVEEDGSW